MTLLAFSGQSGMEEVYRTTFDVSTLGPRLFCCVIMLMCVSEEDDLLEMIDRLMST